VTGLIEEISIKNVGGIASISMRLETGFTVITGESGAGKSSLVRALELIGGKRSQALFIRSGEEEASVEAVFSGSAERVSKTLQPRDEDGLLFARRILSRGGRNRCFFQDKATPFSTFASLMNDRMRIQSQFAQIELLDPKRQMDILDFCCGAQAEHLRAALENTFDEALRCDRELRAVKSKEQELKLRFRDAEAIAEALRPLQISPGCDLLWERELDEKNRTFQQARKVRENLLELTGGASNDGMIDRLESCALELIRRLFLEKTDVEASFNEGLSFLHSFISSIEEKASALSPEKIERERDLIEKKLGILRKIKRTTGTRTAEELVSWTSDAQEAIGWLREEGRLSSELLLCAKKLRREASSLAMELRALRQRAADSLEKEVNRHLQELGMAESVFSVKLLPLDKIRSSGADEISFTLSSGGSEEMPVNKSASGGELSRILLALQLALPEETLPPTLIFDEVEAGLGGKAALLAGYKLLALSRKTQVILVTHEATIASLADHHFLVKKTTDCVEVKKLERDDRIGEVARMLSGDASLQEAREHAERLLYSAESTECSQSGNISVLAGEGDLAALRGKV